MLSGQGSTIILESDAFSLFAKQMILLVDLTSFRAIRTYREITRAINNGAPSFEQSTNVVYTVTIRLINLTVCFRRIAGVNAFFLAENM